MTQTRQHVQACSNFSSTRCYNLQYFILVQVKVNLLSRFPGHNVTFYVSLMSCIGIIITIYNTTRPAEDMLVLNTRTCFLSSYSGSDQSVYKFIVHAHIIAGCGDITLSMHTNISTDSKNLHIACNIFSFLKTLFIPWALLHGGGLVAKQ